MKLKDCKDIVMPKKKIYPDGCEWDEEFKERGSKCPDDCGKCIHGYNKGKVEGFNDFNDAIDICGEIDIPSIDEGRIINTINDFDAKFHLSKGHRKNKDLAKAIVKELGGTQ